MSFFLIVETSKAISEQSQRDAIAHRLQEDVVSFVETIISYNSQ